MSFSKINPIKAGIIGGASLLAIATAASSFFTVDANSTAVVTRFGKLEYTVGPGLHFMVPFVNSAYTYRNDMQTIVSGKDWINTYTIDNQEVDVTFTIFYRIPPDQVSCVFTSDRDYESRLWALAIDRMKAAMGVVNVQSVAEKRGELRDRIKNTLKKDSKSLCVEVTDFQLSNLRYTDSFRNAVNNAAVQKANIETIEYQKQQAEKQAETDKIAAIGKANAARETARGEADAQILRAEAQAKSIQLKGEAEAAAIKAQAEALKGNKELVALRQAGKGWDGKLPQAIYSGPPIPFMPMSNTFPKSSSTVVGSPTSK